ncbi:MAG: T9SS type A sorting domain-containing protein [Bacteroidales bacterium]|nr:T9SS type A sorting domain-containing protein [Bacteroidales bacterium]
MPDRAIPLIGDLFKVYPNPTTGTFTLELAGLDQTKIARVEIFSMAGYKLLVAELNGGGSHVLSLSGKPAGIYLIKVVSDKKSGAANIVVVHN